MQDCGLGEENIPKSKPLMIIMRYKLSSLTTLLDFCKPMNYPAACSNNTKTQSSYTKRNTANKDHLPSWSCNWAVSFHHLSCLYPSFVSLTVLPSLPVYNPSDSIFKSIVSLFFNIHETSVVCVLWYSFMLVLVIFIHVTV